MIILLCHFKILIVSPCEVCKVKYTWIHIEPYHRCTYKVLRYVLYSQLHSFISHQTGTIPAFTAQPPSITAHYHSFFIPLSKEAELD